MKCTKRKIGLTFIQNIRKGHYLLNLELNISDYCSKVSTAKMVKKAKSKSTGDLANPLSSSQQSVESTTEDHRAKGPAAGSSQAAKVTSMHSIKIICIIL